MEMQHFFHEHPLRLVRRGGEEEVEEDDDHDELEAVRYWVGSCAGCDDVLFGEFYACHPCRFYLHQACANLPQRMDHSIHPNCPLLLTIASKSQASGRQEMMLSYRCEACDFLVDASSRHLQPSSHLEEGQLLHFSHGHPLTTYEEIDTDTGILCHGCTRHILGKFYGCKDCHFYLDEECVNLPRKIQHFYHSCPLVLVDIRNHGAKCHACFWDFHYTSVFGYHCKKCNFNMHPSCAQFSPIGSDEKGIHHFLHHHPLRLTCEVDAEHLCQGCRKPKVEQGYACDSCGVFLHESCAGLQQEIQHPLHSCPLSLKFTGREAECDACYQPCSRIAGYRCERHDFNMHPMCVQSNSPVSSDDEGDRIQHMSHHHPLTLCEEAEAEGEESLQCNLCRRPITRQAAYGACELCQFYIHKSCMGFSEEIQNHCHPCPLLPKLHRKFSCNTCCAQRSCTLAYQCSKLCEFYMDIECAHFSSAFIVDDQAEHILHFSHHHPLKLFKDIKRNLSDTILNKVLACFVCECLASGLTYGCRECDIFLHKPCLDVLPQFLTIKDTLLILVRSRDSRCSKCERSFSGFFFIPYNVKREEYNRSFSSFNLYTMKEEKFIFGCYCVSCALTEALSFRVDSSLLLIKHPFHPCNLNLKFFSTFNCNSCFTHCHSHAYYCSQCDYYVGTMCAQFAATDSAVEGRWIQHFCHWHLLELSLDAAISEEDSACRICGTEVLSEPSCFCSECGFRVHTSCLDILPLKVDHHYYFNCTLVMLTTPTFKCMLCQEESDSGLAFRSIEGGFKLCMGCFFRPKNKLNDDGTFSSLHHLHALSLVKNLEKAAECHLCGGHGLIGMYYCSGCQYYFHEACAELPFELQHPLHPQHPLTLISTSQLPESSRSCNLCLRKFMSGGPSQSGVYHCRTCSFSLDRKCATCIPSIQYQGHPHLLTVVECMYDEEVCQVCSASCKDSGNVFCCAECSASCKDSSNVFRCAECKFSLHLSCGPLPCMIKHPCHVHLLVLEDFHAEENYTDMFPCHVCEQVRDAMRPVYRCTKGCPMVCGIRCAISEVVPKLLGHDGGDVELRTTFPHVESKVIPRDEILEGTVQLDFSWCGIHSDGLSFESADREDKLKTADTIEDWEREMLKNNDNELKRGDGSEDGDNTNYSFSKEAFNRFSGELGYTPTTLKRAKIPEFILRHGGPEVVVRGEYLVPKTLVPIYQELFGEYGIFETNENLKRGYRDDKSYFISILCAVLHDMRKTKVVELTGERVRQWRTLLNLVERAGFEVGFLDNKIKRVWDAHFLIKAKARLDDKSDRLHKEHKRLSELEEELVRKLEDTREQKAKIEEEEAHHHKYGGTEKKILRKEYAEALLIKWKPASSAILESTDQLWPARNLEDRVWWKRRTVLEENNSGVPFEGRGGDD